MSFNNKGSDETRALIVESDLSIGRNYFAKITYQA